MLQRQTGRWIKIEYTCKALSYTFQYMKGRGTKAEINFIRSNRYDGLFTTIIIKRISLTMQNENNDKMM